MSINFLIIYATTIFIASIIPGPSMLLALTHGMKYGIKRTAATAMGNAFVTFIQASVSIAGLGTILVASETIFFVIKWTGAAYLVYIGITVLLSSEKSMVCCDNDESMITHSIRKMFMQGAMVTAGNPKAIVFFSAVFPQFLNPEIPFISQYCILMSTGIFIAFVCFMLYAVSGQKIVSLFSSMTAGKWIKRFIGTSFIGAGIGLAFSKR